MASKLMNVALLNNFLKNKTSFDRTLNKVGTYRMNYLFK